MHSAFEQRKQSVPLDIESCFPQVVITGDLQISVTESDAAHGSITGNYSIETWQMQEPLQVCWGAEGQVRNRLAKTTAITFEIPQARAGHSWVYSVQAQVTDQRKSIVTGVFVQILVTADTLPQVLSVG